MDSPSLLQLQMILQLSITLSVKSQFMPQPFPFPPSQMPMRLGSMPGHMGPMNPIGQMGSMGQMGQMGFGMPMPGMPPPMAMPMPQQKLPVVVMPFYSKSADKNQKRFQRRKVVKQKRRYDSCESDSESDSTDDDYRRHNNRRNIKNGKRQVLTPVVSYVTKDGYVVFQKKISKSRPNEWLDVDKTKLSEHSEEMIGVSSEERYDGLSLKRSSKRRRGH